MYDHFTDVISISSMRVDTLVCLVCVCVCVCVCVWGGGGYKQTFCCIAMMSLWKSI